MIETLPDRTLRHWQDNGAVDKLTALRKVLEWARGTKRCQLCHTNHQDIGGTGGRSVTLERHQDDCPITAYDALRGSE